MGSRDLLVAGKESLSHTDSGSKLRETPVACSCFIWNKQPPGAARMEGESRKAVPGFSLPQLMRDICHFAHISLTKSSHVALSDCKGTGKCCVQNREVCTCSTFSPPIPSSVVPGWSGLHHSFHHSLLIPKANGNFHITTPLGNISANQSPTNLTCTQLPSCLILWVPLCPHSAPWISPHPIHL